MIFKQVFDPKTSTYTYFIGSAKGREAVIIDPVIENVNEYIKLLKELDLKLVKVIDTHIHADHISGLNELNKQTNCVRIMGEKSESEVIDVRLKENITNLEPNQIFCYGANELFRHGAGAAKLALKWGAKHGMAGLVGQTYGIPTKDKKIQTLSLDKIQVHVNDFLATAFSHQEYEFLVTKIGCGLALYRPKDIAPRAVQRIRALIDLRTPVLKSAGCRR